MPKKLYFGHPVNVYGTDLEIKLLEKIAAHFPGWNIENPNQKNHQEGYELWKKTRGNGMDYFFQEVLSGCEGGIFLPFRDGKWGAGVFGEARYIALKGYPIWQIDTGLIVGPTDISSMQSLVLTVEETRSRVRANGKIVPY
ncbi:MAG: hypothetical protein V1867_01720 [Candidatus Falkowbacteria bacterium]